MRRLKKTAVILQAVLMMFLLTACWNYREVESLTIVSGMAIDYGQNGYKYHMTFECVNLSGGGGGGGGGGQAQQNSKPLLIESDGDTLFDSVRNALFTSNKKLYFSDCKIVILSNQIAKDGIRQVLDWYLRDAEPRVTLNFLVSEEGTAAETLRYPAPDSVTASFQINNMLNQSKTVTASYIARPLYEIYNTLNDEEGISLTLPGITVVENMDGKTLSLDRGAVFQKDKLVGWLPKLELKYLLFGRDKIKGGLLITGADPMNPNITLEILKSKTSVKPVIRDGAVTMDISVKTEAALAEVQDGTRPSKSPPFETVEQYADQTLETGIENLVADAQQNYKSDILGFGSYIQENAPSEWEKLKSGWQSRFPSVKIQVHADVQIKNSAVLLEKGGK